MGKKLLAGYFESIGGDKIVEKISKANPILRPIVPQVRLSKNINIFFSVIFVQVKYYGQPINSKVLVKNEKSL